MSTPPSRLHPRRLWLVVAIKEMRETLRDRRTLVPMVVLPIVLYPAVFLLVFQLAHSQRTELESEPTRVALGLHGALVAPAFDGVDGLQPSAMLPDAAYAALEAGDTDVVVEAAAAELSEAASTPVTIHFDQASERSRLGRDRVEEALVAWSKAIVAERLAARELPGALSRPLDIMAENRATPAEMGGWLLGQILPLFIVMMVALGAYYPAVDLTAGERERGTLLTLLTAPITPAEVVVGKFAAVLLLSFLTALCNIGSVALFFGHGASFLGELSDQVEVSLTAAAWVGLLTTAAALGAFLSALMMATAVLARTFKEAQSYLTPVYLLAVVPAVVAQLPGIELGPGTALSPGVNAALLLKAFLLDSATAQSTFLVLASTAVYTAAILAFAARLFGRESVVLGDGGWRELFAWRSTKAVAPFSTADALGLYAFVFALFYYLAPWLGRALPLPPLAAAALHLLLLVAAPTLTYLWLRGQLLPQALGLTRPPRLAWAAATLAGACAWAPIGWLVERFQQPTLPIPVEELERFSALLDPPQSALGWVGWLAALALAPALAEEVLFRGALLRAFMRTMAPWGAIALSAILFAALHLSVYRFVATCSLGVIAGTVAWRARSLWPAMLFHACNNASALGFAALAAASRSPDSSLETTIPAEAAALGALGLAGALALLARVSRPPTSAT